MLARWFKRGNAKFNILLHILIFCNFNNFNPNNDSSLFNILLSNQISISSYLKFYQVVHERNQVIANQAKYIHLTQNRHFSGQKYLGMHPGYVLGLFSVEMTVGEGEESLS